jgi:uncharacterized UPF0160 family protein
MKKLPNCQLIQKSILNRNKIISEEKDVDRRINMYFSRIEKLKKKQSKLLRKKNTLDATLNNIEFQFSISIDRDNGNMQETSDAPMERKPLRSIPESISVYNEENCSVTVIKKDELRRLM